MVNGHSFIPDIYIAPLQETYTEPLSVQLRPKRNVLRSLHKEDTLSRGSKRSVGGSLFQVGGANSRESSKLFRRRADHIIYISSFIVNPMTHRIRENGRPTGDQRETSQFII